MAVIDTSELFKKIKEENKNHEALLNTKLTEGNKQLMQILNSMKQDSFINQSKQVPESYTTTTPEHFSMMKSNEDNNITQNEKQIKNQKINEKNSIESLNNIEQNNKKEEDIVETFANNKIQSINDNDNNQQEDDQIQEEGLIKMKTNKNKASKNTQKEKKKATGIKHFNQEKYNDQVNQKGEYQNLTASQLKANQQMMEKSDMINFMNSLSKEDKAIDSYNNNLSNNDKSNFDNKRKLKEM